MSQRLVFKAICDYDDDDNDHDHDDTYHMALKTSFTTDFKVNTCRPFNQQGAAYHTKDRSSFFDVGTVLTQL